MEEAVSWVGRLVQGGVVPVMVVLGALWKWADRILSPAGTKLIFSYIRGAVEQPADSAVDRELSRLLSSWFSRSNGFWPFLRNVAVMTLASLAILLSIYVSRTTGMLSALLSGGFIRQFFGNGFVVTFLVNGFTFTIYGKVLADISSSTFGRSVLMLFVDAAVKLLFFIILTALTYVLFAELGNAFGGRFELAILAVPRTILGAARFENLTGVYFYSVVISSFPLFIVAIIRMLAANPGFAKVLRSLLFWFPVEQKPLRAVALVFALFVGFFSLMASLLLSPVSG